MWEFNFGEWSEAYVFLRLLGNGRIYAADDKFEKNSNVYVDVINIIRYEGTHMLEFKRLIDKAEAYDNGVQFKILTSDDLIRKADYLYNAMRSIKSSDRKFSVADIEFYLKGLRFTQPKVPNLPKDIAVRYGKKTDIIITIKDSIDQVMSTTGFSIKSHLGSASTLFNSAMSSKMTYEIEGCDDAQMNLINGREIDSELGMIAYIKNHPKLALRFAGTSEAFKDNLDLIELTMSDIFGCMMLIQTGYYDRADSSKTKDIVKKIAEKNPVNVRRPEIWYEAKFKDFLYAAFSGLTATDPWDGRRKLSGGYIDVSVSGEMLYYRAVSDDVFNTYMFERTFIDRPSRGVNKDIAKVVSLAALEGRTATKEEIRSAGIDKDGKPKPKKGDWGYVYKKDGKYYLDINFQIRFK